METATLFWAMGRLIRPSRRWLRRLLRRWRRSVVRLVQRVVIYLLLGLMVIQVLQQLGWWTDIWAAVESLF